jgi:uncharacterized protein YjeT (DUF2065 family)
MKALLETVPAALPLILGGLTFIFRPRWYIKYPTNVESKTKGLRIAGWIVVVMATLIALEPAILKIIPLLMKANPN